MMILYIDIYNFPVININIGKNADASITPYPIMILLRAQNSRFHFQTCYHT